jgi:starch synthase (maltosyl-transferring)
MMLVRARSGELVALPDRFAARARASNMTHAFWRFANANDDGDSDYAPMFKHIVIEAITPSVDCGRFPAKRIAGESCIVEADIFRDGPEPLAAVIKWRRVGETEFHESPMHPLDNDRWSGEFPLPENARYEFSVDAWTREFAAWRDYFRKKAATRLEVASNLLEGIELLKGIHRRARGDDRDRLAAYIQRLSGLDDPHAAVEIISELALEEIAERCGMRLGMVTSKPALEVIADRELARFGAWYEMFPRSQGSEPGRHATLREAERRLHEIRDLGFDVVYLTPIHPIGRNNRKGPNNALRAHDGSPGSPWAIGAAAGGHDAVEPQLGTLEDFDRFAATARRLGMEVALDFAIQCSPDHPWVTAHPEWFNRRPDGTIKYAENPPKQYQDVYPVNFDSRDQKGLAEEIRRCLLFWIGHGVSIFRVDNPHTKPVAFWQWLISDIQRAHPETIFLSEAFTRPKMMNALAKAGFTQSYTYFTWRNTKQELTEYIHELAHTGMDEYFRPNFFTNTPDILPPVLQHGEPPAFKMRLVLAATLSPSYGIYSGFELCENDAIEGTEEYLDSEKYEIKVRDWNRPGNINEFIARINAIRRENPALHEFSNIRFLDTDNDQIIFYAKATADLSNVVLVAVNLDPMRAHHCTAFVPPEVVGAAPGENYEVTDLVTGARYSWGERNYVRLDPAVEPAHILRIDR